MARGLGATVILPKHLLTAALAGGSGDYEHLLRDNYETPVLRARAGRPRVRIAAT